MGVRGRAKHRIRDISVSIDFMKKGFRNEVVDSLLIVFFYTFSCRANRNGDMNHLMLKAPIVIVIL